MEEKATKKRTTKKTTELTTGEPPRFTPRKELTVYIEPGDSPETAARKTAATINSPEFGALRVISRMQPTFLSNEIDNPGFLKVLRDQASAVQKGDMANPEAMLMNQASALQSMFVRLSERAMDQTMLPTLEGFMRLALRAQSQCRATLETLSTIKNPPVVFAKQANIANGHQQINNGVTTPRTQENVIEPNELFEDQHGKQLDSGATGQAIPSHPAMETVGTIHRAKVGGRQGEGIA